MFITYLGASPSAGFHFGNDAPFSLQVPSILSNPLRVTHFLDGHMLLAPRAGDAVGMGYMVLQITRVEHFCVAAVEDHPMGTVCPLVHDVAQPTVLEDSRS